MFIIIISSIVTIIVVIINYNIVSTHLALALDM